MERAKDRSSTPGHPEAGGQEGITNDPSWQETLPGTSDSHRSGDSDYRYLHEAAVRLRGGPLRQREGRHGSHATVTRCRDSIEAHNGALT